MTDKDDPGVHYLKPVKGKRPPVEKEGALSYVKAVQLARIHTQEAMAVLIELMGAEHPWQARLKAAEIVLERGWGKPRQDVALLGADQSTMVPALHLVVNKIKGGD